MIFNKKVQKRLIYFNLLSFFLKTTLSYFYLCFELCNLWKCSTSTQMQIVSVSLLNEYKCSIILKVKGVGRHKVSRINAAFMPIGSQAEIKIESHALKFFIIFYTLIAAVVDLMSLLVILLWLWLLHFF